MTSAKQFEGKVALVTGAAAGIGKTSALAFADAGASVVVADISPEQGQEVVESIKSNGGTATFIKCDVQSEDDVRNLIEEAVRQFGKIDCAYNNAGVPGGAFVPLAEQTNETWDKVINTDLRGVWLCMKYEIQQMLKQGGGAIVNCASSCGLVGQEGWSIYVAAKHGVVGLTKAAALDYATQNIRINAVAPCAIFTASSAAAKEVIPPEEWDRIDAAIIASQPQGRWGKPEEVADAVLWLCSPGASLMLGHALAVDGGLTIR
jgi:NAD(P)-dependent dehydrogenase (short-subunit alcohol dehydrogenase family)